MPTSNSDNPLAIAARSCARPCTPICAPLVLPAHVDPHVHPKRWLVAAPSVTIAQPLNHLLPSQPPPHTPPTLNSPRGGSVSSPQWAQSRRHSRSPWVSGSEFEYPIKATRSSLFSPPNTPPAFTSTMSSANATILIMNPGSPDLCSSTVYTPYIHSPTSQDPSRSSCSPHRLRE